MRRNFDEAAALAEKAIANSGIAEGLVTVFVAHSTCGVTIIECEPGCNADLNTVLERPRPARLLARLRIPLDALLAAWAVVGAAAVHLLLYSDAEVLRLYNFHLNGFVWNLLTTPGGVESLEAGAATKRTFTLIAVGFLVLQAVLWWIACRGRWLVTRLPSPPRRRRLLAASGLVLAVSLFERGTYCVCHITQFHPVLAAADTFPLYVPLHWRALGRMLGIAARRDPDLVHGVHGSRLEYPLSSLAPIPRRAPDSTPAHASASPTADRPPWNIVWLVAESLRADMLDDEIMPASSAFARQATNFRHHYSGGNGTRMGLFAMFYGLYGNCWFPMLEAGRGPVLMDALLDAGYDVQAFTSARFSYPEFDRTIFVRVPHDRLHEGDTAREGWENDRANVTALLASLDGRDAGNAGSNGDAGAPFFRFMFFESPHARYVFPPDAVIREPYLPELDYADLNLERDIELIRARYVNACHHLDTQYARVIEGLRERGLLDSTIVILTGDHGEEFLECGHWGHNSAFTDPQTLTPLVLWVPGRPPAEVSTMTSHLDLPATLLSLLGVTSPPDQYSLGIDLFGGAVRERTVIADWDQMALVDAQLGKFVLPFRSGRLTGSAITTPADGPVSDEAAARAAFQPFVSRTLTEMGRFLR